MAPLDWQGISPDGFLSYRLALIFIHYLATAHGVVSNPLKLISVIKVAFPNFRIFQVIGS
jgi:hypothetical protein